MFWIMWTLCFNINIESSLTLYIATPVIAFGGFFINLTFDFFWERITDMITGSEPIGLEANDSLDRTRNLLDETDTTQDVDIETPITVTPLPDNDDTEQPTNLSQTFHQTSYRRRPSSFEVTTTAAETTEQKPPKATVDYINNIKIFLTSIVIIHHCYSSGQGFTIQDMVSPTSQRSWGNVTLFLFTMLNQSYFMNLFFFFSGYFVPKSLDKKGVHEFLFDRAKRLLIPFVVYSFFLGTFVEYGFRSLFFPNKFDFPSGTYNWGPTWFLIQLMIFSIIYAFACGERWNPSIKCPSLLGFFIIGIIIGIFAGILAMFTPPAGSFMTVPVFWSSYLSYIVYFFGGAVAQRNDWMTSIKNMSRVVIYLWAVLSTALYCPIFLFFIEDMASVPFALLAMGVLWKGVLCMGLSLAVTVFFMDYSNRKFKYLTPFFSKAMYTAYIIQFAFPMIVGGWSVVKIFDATGNIEYIDGAPYISNDNLIFPGWLLCCVITLAIVWPLSYAIRSIPGFSQVL